MLDDKLLNITKEQILWDEETKENLIEIKKNIVRDFIESMKNNDKNIDDYTWKYLEKYLVNDGSIEDVIQDIFRWCRLYILLPESIDKINKVKQKISSIQKIPTEDQLSSLKLEIKEFLQENTWNIKQQDIQTNTWVWSQDFINLSEITEQENKFIKSIYQRASQQIGKQYTRWWISPSAWFDCSGLWYRAFKEEWIKFSQRLTAHKFSDADVDIRKDEVKIWDFMFWDQKPNTKKHDSIYHIEMVISKPYIKNWKTYVRTLWSSTDAEDDRGNYVGKWVQIREREMKDYRHYWRPTYYYQLAQYEKSWSKDDLIAWSSGPTKDLENKVLSA